MQLRLIATRYDDFWHRQHFKGFDNKRNYCTVEINKGEFQIHSFAGEPDCPIRADIDVIEVDKNGNLVKQWQEGSKQ